MFWPNSDAEIEDMTRLKLRNRFALTVICCWIYHCLEVSRKKWIKSRARSASNLSTYEWPTDSDILCNKLLKAQIYFDSNTQTDWISEWFLLQRFSHFEQGVKIDHSAWLDCIARVYIRFERFFVVKKDVTPSTSRLVPVVTSHRTCGDVTARWFNLDMVSW